MLYKPVVFLNMKKKCANIIYFSLLAPGYVQLHSKQKINTCNKGQKRNKTKSPRPTVIRVSLEEHGYPSQSKKINGYSTEGLVVYYIVTSIKLLHPPLENACFSPGRRQSTRFAFAISSSTKPFINQPTHLVEGSEGGDLCRISVRECHQSRQ